MYEIYFMEYFSLFPDKLKSPIGAAGDGVSIIGEKRDPFHRFGPCSGVLNSRKFVSQGHVSV